MRDKGFCVRAGLAVTLSAAALVGTAGVAGATEAATGSIRGTVFFDRDANGEQDAGEPGNHRLPYGGEVFVEGAGGRKYAERDHQGRYVISGLKPGLYRLVSEQRGLQETTRASRRVLVFGGGERVVDFGVRGHTVTGRAWLDANADGIRQDGEQLSTLEDYFLGGGTMDGYLEPERAQVDVRTGAYRWDDLPDGDYFLQDLAAAPGYTFTKQHASSEHPDRDSDFSEGNGLAKFRLDRNSSGHPVTISNLDIGYRQK